MNFTDTTNIAQAGIDDGAVLDVGSAAVSGMGATSLFVQATDETVVDAQLSHTGVLSAVAGTYDITPISQK